MLGLVTEEKKKRRSKASPQKVAGLAGLMKGIFTIDGWSDDKEKFKIDLVNDIKDFLFTKWEKPWKASLVFSETGKLLSGYRNINGRIYKNLANVLTLERNSHNNPFFITIGKLKELGGKILDSNKVVSIVSYVPMWKDKEDKTPRPPDFVLPKFHPAINLEFVEGVKSPKLEIEQFQKLELNQYVENFIKELKKRRRIPTIIYDQADSCHYKYARGTYKPESIHMVKIDTFKNIESYYSTLFHEITHSTKNPDRLGRGKLTKAQTLAYANEELVAEMGAMIICEELGLKYNRQNSLPYLKHWLGKTDNVDTALLEAYSYAAESAEYLLKDIDLQKLVPESMVKRVKAEKTEPRQMKLTLNGPKSKKEDRKIKSSMPDLPNTKNTIALDKWKPSSHIKPLKGQLGQFLGGYERKQFAIVLRGEKGAGKTRLLCQMINLFAQDKLNGLFLSLEVSPESELFGNYISYISKKAKKHVAVSNANTVEELEEYAKKYDFIAVDSWGKLKNIGQEDFIRLIEKYPNVLWLCIFQSTTNGTARGGIMSEYDSSIVIQVAKGGNAQCEKNRYNSCDIVYNVFDKKIIKDEN